MTTPDGTVRIHSHSSGWRDRARAYKVMIDGEHRASVANGDSIDVPVTATTHRIRIAIDWSGSEEIEVDIPPGGVVAVECAARPLSKMPFDLFTRTRWVDLRVVT